MKKTIIYILVVAILSGLIGFGAYRFINRKIENSNDITSYVFASNNKNFVMGSIFTEELYGKANKYSEMESCAFSGLDKTYTYDNYEVYTFPDGDKDKILSIYFLNENAKTIEGISIGSNFEEMIDTYGENYKIQGNQYTYSKDKTSLKIIVENNIVVSIEYAYDYEK